MLRAPIQPFSLRFAPSICFESSSEAFCLFFLMFLTAFQSVLAHKLAA